MVIDKPTHVVTNSLFVKSEITVRQILKVVKKQYLTLIEIKILKDFAIFIKILISLKMQKLGS